MSVPDESYFPMCPQMNHWKMIRMQAFWMTHGTYQSALRVLQLTLFCLSVKCSRQTAIHTNKVSCLLCTFLQIALPCYPYLSFISPPMQSWTVTEEELLVAAKSQRVICDVDCLYQLLGPACREPRCPQAVSVVSTYTGATLSLCWQCEHGHQGNWSSSKRCKSKTGYPFFLNDLLAASAVLLSGNHYFKLAVLCKFLNLQLSQSKSKSQAICLTSSRFLQTASRQPQNRTHRTPAALHSHPLPPRRALAHLPLHAHLTASYQQG
jgi:hypothetical protein